MSKYFTNGAKNHLFIKHCKIETFVGHPIRTLMKGPLIIEEIYMSIFDQKRIKFIKEKTGNTSEKEKLLQKL